MPKRRYLDDVTYLPKGGEQLQEVIVTPNSEGNYNSVNFQDEVENERKRQRNIARRYLSSAPTLSNLYNGITAFVNSLPVVGVDASDIIKKRGLLNTGVAPLPTIRNEELPIMISNIEKGRSSIKNLLNSKLYKNRLLRRLNETNYQGDKVRRIFNITKGSENDIDAATVSTPEIMYSKINNGREALGRFDKKNWNVEISRHQPLKEILPSAKHEFAHVSESIETEALNRALNIVPKYIKNDYDKYVVKPDETRARVLNSLSDLIDKYGEEYVAKTLGTDEEANRLYEGLKDNSDYIDLIMTYGSDNTRSLMNNIVSVSPFIPLSIYDFKKRKRNTR